MKISLVYPSVLNLSFPPLGILYIAAVLKEEGHEVTVSDINSTNRKEEVGRIRGFGPSLVGVSIINTTQINFATELIKELRSFLPQAHFTCGGTYSTVFPRRLLEELEIDTVVLGEGEATVKELVRNIASGSDLKEVKGIFFRRNNEIIENERREFMHSLDEISLPARELVDFDRYLRPPGVLRGFWRRRSTTIITGRGCPSHCIYCGSNLIFGRVLRRRSVDNVISEIRHLVDKYRIDGIWFADDTFTLDKNWVIEFADKLKRERADIKWGAQARVTTVDFEMLIAMKKAGCVQLDFGVESGSLRVLKTLRKGITPEAVIRAFDLTKKAGIRSLATFMVGNPGEAYEDIKETLALSKRIRADFTIFFFTTAYPGTELFDMAVKNNWLRNHDYSQWFVREPSALEIVFSRNELIKIRSRLQNTFAVRNIASSLSNPIFLVNIIMFTFLNLPALIGALKIFAKTKNFDDFVFNFIEKAKK